MHQDQKGEVWIGYDGGGLVAFQDGAIRTYTTQNGLASNQIQSIREAANGDLLIATAEGLSRMHNGHFSNFVVPEPLSRPFLFDALEDRKERVARHPQRRLSNEGNASAQYGSWRTNHQRFRGGACRGSGRQYLGR